MRTAYDHAARALLAVAVVALVADALLGALTTALGTLGGGGMGAWWVTGHVLERSRWVAFAALLVPLARTGLLPSDASSALSGPATWRAVGVLAMALPLAWIGAQWLVQAALITAGGQWDVDGLVFLSADYYRRIFAGYVPWLLGSAAALVASRHVG